MAKFPKSVDDPFYVIQPMYSNGNSAGASFGYETKATAIREANRLLQSNIFEGNKVRIITRDGEHVWSKRRKSSSLGFPGHVSLTSKLLVTGGVILGALASLGFRAAAKPTPAPAPLPPVPPPVVPPVDPNSVIVMSSYYRVNGACRRFMQMASGLTKSESAQDSLCEPDE